MWFSFLRLACFQGRKSRTRIIDLLSGDIVLQRGRSSFTFLWRCFSENLLPEIEKLSFILLSSHETTLPRLRLSFQLIKIRLKNIKLSFTDIYPTFIADSSIKNICVTFQSITKSVKQIL